VFLTSASELILCMAGPRLPALFLHGDEAFHRQIGEAGRTFRHNLICFYLVRFQSNELLRGQIGVPTFFPLRIPAKAPECSGTGLSSNGALLLED
jgi:hypothetical protein